MIRSAQTQVLIETLWYVKAYQFHFHRPHGSGFNRNIVECKVQHTPFISRDLFRFNRNIVECKVMLMRSEWEGTGGFNRNIVECKEAFLRSSIAAIIQF